MLLLPLCRARLSYMLIVPTGRARRLELECCACRCGGESGNPVYSMDAPWPDTECDANSAQGSLTCTPQNQWYWQCLPGA